jgi:hypothetical protein
MGRILEWVVLGVSALVLIVVGAASAFVPAAFYAGYGIEVDSPALASELRATGVALLLLGLAVAVGAIWRRWVFPAAVVAALVLVGYALGRIVSAVADGAPDASLAFAGAAELVLGAAAAVVAIRTRPRA